VWILLGGEPTDHSNTESSITIQTLSFSRRHSRSIRYTDGIRGTIQRQCQRLFMSREHSETRRTSSERPLHDASDLLQPRARTRIIKLETMRRVYKASSRIRTDDSGVETRET